MEYKYPVKFAIMPIFEYVSWKNDYKVIGYVAEKCYVISKTTNYLADGTSEEEYGIVFMHKQVDFNRIDVLDLDHPEYENNKCINTCLAYNLYDDYDTCKKDADELNNQLFATDKEINSVTYILRILKNIDGMLQNNTPVDIKPVQKSNNIIAMYPDEDKIINMSIFEFIKENKNMPFYVCNVAKQDYEKMMRDIKRNGMLSERNSRMMEYVYDRFRYLLLNDLNNEIIKLVDCDSNSFKGSYYIKNGEMFYDENMVPFDKDLNRINGLKIYTTTTYQDIINTYKIADKQKQLIKRF